MHSGKRPCAEEGFADLFLENGGAAGPPTRFFHAIQAYRKDKSCHHHVCSREHPHSPTLASFLKIKLWR